MAIYKVKETININEDSINSFKSDSSNINSDLLDYLFSQVEFNIARIVEPDVRWVSDYTDIIETYDGTITKDEYKDTYDYLMDLIHNAEYYVNYEDNYKVYIQLSDNHTIWDLNVPVDENEYVQAVLDAFDEFETRTGVEAYSFGRSGRHICVDLTLDNLKNYKELVKVQKELETSLINKFNGTDTTVATESTTTIAYSNRNNLFAEKLLPILKSYGANAVVNKADCSIIKFNGNITKDEVNSIIECLKAKGFYSAGSTYGTDPQIKELVDDHMLPTQLKLLSYSDGTFDIEVSTLNTSISESINSVQKRIANYKEFDNGNVLFDMKKLTSAEAEELAKQSSIKDPSNIYYVKYDNIMEPASNLRWINGVSYDYNDYKYIGIRAGKPCVETKKGEMLCLEATKGRNSKVYEWVSNSGQSSDQFGAELNGSTIDLANNGEKIGKFSLYKFNNAYCLAKRRLADGKWIQIDCFDSEKKARKYALKHIRESAPLKDRIPYNVFVVGDRVKVKANDYTGTVTSVYHYPSTLVTVTYDEPIFTKTGYLISGDCYTPAELEFILDESKNTVKEGSDIYAKHDELIKKGYSVIRDYYGKCKITRSLWSKEKDIEISPEEADRLIKDHGLKYDDYYSSIALSWYGKPRNESRETTTESADFTGPFKIRFNDYRTAVDITDTLGFGGCVSINNDNKGYYVTGDETTLHQFIDQYNQDIGELDLKIEEFKEAVNGSSDNDEYKYYKIEIFDDIGNAESGPIIDKVISIAKGKSAKEIKNRIIKDEGHDGCNILCQTTKEEYDAYHSPIEEDFKSTIPSSSDSNSVFTELTHNSKKYIPQSNRLTKILNKIIEKCNDYKLFPTARSKHILNTWGDALDIWYEDNGFTFDKLKQITKEDLAQLDVDLNELDYFISDFTNLFDIYEAMYLKDAEFIDNYADPYLEESITPESKASIYETTDLVKDLTAIDGIDKVDFDLSNYPEVPVVIILTHRDFGADDFGREHLVDFFNKQRSLRNAATEVFKKYGLEIEDPMEDMGSWDYWVLRGNLKEKTTNLGTEDNDKPKFEYMMVEFFENDSSIDAIMNRTRGVKYSDPAKLSEILIQADAQYSDIGYAKVYFDNYIRYQDKLYKLHAGRVDLGDGPQAVTLPANYAKIVEDYFLAEIKAGNDRIPVVEEKF